MTALARAERTESHMLAIATSCLRREIAARLDEMAETGEAIELDPNSSAVIRLRDRCKEITDRVSSDRLVSATESQE